MGNPTVLKSPATPPTEAVSSLAGPIKLSVFNFTFSTSYATGGEAFDPAVSNPYEVKDVIAVSVIGSGSGHIFSWDSVNKKIKAFWSGTASAVLNEVASTTNLSVTPGTLRVLVLHK